VTVVTAPTITNFTADKPAINSGDSATLIWGVVGADSVAIDQGIGLTSGVGSLKVSPHVTTTYKLTATNVAGSTIATTTITVNSPVQKRRAVRH